VFVLLAETVPWELDFHTSIFIGVDLFVGRANHDGVLRPVDVWPGQRRGAPFDVVRHEFGPVVVMRAQRGVSAFLGLTGMLRAAVNDANWAPAAVHVLARMTGQREGNAWLQPRVIAFHKCDARVAAEPAQAVLGEGLAGLIELGAGGIVIALVAASLMIQVASVAGMLMGIAGMMEGVVALGLPRGAYVLGVCETSQRGLRLVAAEDGVVQNRLIAHASMNEQAIAVDKLMARRAMAEGIEEAFFAHEALDEVVVGVAGLHAIFAGPVLGGAAQLVVLGQSMCLEHGLGDLRNGAALENAPIRTEMQARQTRLDDGGIARPAKAGFVLDES